MIPVERVRAIVDDWLAGFDTPADAYRLLDSATGLKADTWRKRLTDEIYVLTRGTWRGWWSYAELDVADVDELLVAAGLTHLWHTELAEYAPPPERLSNKVRLPGERLRIKRLGKDARLTREQIHALHRLHIEGGVSLRELCRRGWRQWGYASEKSALNCVCDLLASFGLERRDRIEATQLASTTHGKARRGARDPEHRREGRVRRGEIRDLQCAAVKTRPGRGRGERCERAALRDSEFCISHDPRRAEERWARLAVARSRIGAAA